MPSCRRPQRWPKPSPIGPRDGAEERHRARRAARAGLGCDTRRRRDAPRRAARVGGRAGHAVGAQARAALEPAHRGGGAGAVAAVHRARATRPGGEAGTAGRPRPSRGRRARMVRLPRRGRPRRPSARRVRGPATPSAASRWRRWKWRTALRVRGPGDAVDLAAVDVHGPQRHLEGGHVARCGRAAAGAASRARARIAPARSVMAPGAPCPWPTRAPETVRTARGARNGAGG